MMRLEVTSPLHSNLRALASSVPIGQRGLVHIWGRNDTPIGQKIGISWVVYDPDGIVVEEYSDWKGWPYPTELDPGDEHQFIGGRFDLDKEGTYTLNVDLLMGSPDNPVIVDTYDGDLCTTTVEIPPEFELIEHTIYPFAYIYDGDVERVTATFRTDPFTPSAWVGHIFASRLEKEARARGGHPIEVKVYVDTTPLLWTNFRVEVIGTVLGEAYPMPLWAAVLIIALAIIAVIVVATLATKAIVEIFRHYPELKDVKPGWNKETLVMTIQDSEEFWERAPTPIDTLEAMSEAELRDYLDQIAEEEVPPKKPSIWLWLGIGAATAVAIAIAAKKKKKA